MADGKAAHGMRVVGGRAYLVRPDERLVAKDGRWELFEFTALSNWPWVSLKLFDTHEQVRRRVYQIGYSVRDKRMARTPSWGVVLEKYPETAEWIRRMVEAEFGERKN